jgi:hypothetical protein
MRQINQKSTVMPRRREISDYSNTLGLLTQAGDRTMSVALFYPQIPKTKLHRVNFFNFSAFLLRVLNHWEFNPCLCTLVNFHGQSIRPIPLTFRKINNLSLEYNYGYG